MARKVEIEVQILKNGKVRFNVKGRKGPSCLDFLKIMQNELGRVEHLEYTSEYYEKEQAEGSIETRSDTEE
ncbi:DUF2997 domain-containing protein [bacterium]|nr:DUF2997 domain-containing protein [candidate division CSSED10-310 bacterium]